MGPWTNAANAYQQGLNGLQQTVQHGYDQMAQMPLTIYDRFIQGYTQAKQQKFMEDKFAADQAWKQQELAIQKQRWDQSNEQARLRDNAQVQTLIAKSYRPELRGAIKAQLQAINPDWDEKRIENMLPQTTPDIPKFTMDGQTLPLEPERLDTPRVDTFKGMDVIKEENDASQAEANLKRAYDIQAAQAKNSQELAAIRGEFAKELEGIRAGNRRADIQLRIDAGQYAPRGGASQVDMNDPQIAAALEILGTRGIKTGDFSGLGMGMNPLKVGVLKNMGKQALESGGALPDIAANKATYQADAKSLKDLQGMADNINSFEKTAIGNWSRFEKAIKDLENTGSPVLNRKINWVRSNVGGDPKVSAAIAAGQAAHTEFARLINNPRLVGMLTDSARQEVFRSLPANFEDATPKQIIHVGNVLRADAAQRKQDLFNQILEIKGRISRGPSPAAQTLLDKANGPAERKQFKNNATGAMEWFKRDENGKWVKE